MNHRVVIFSKFGTRVIHTDDISQYKGMPNVLIDPVYPRGVPPDQWKMKDMAKVPTKASRPPVALLMAIAAFITGLIVGHLL